MNLENIFFWMAVLSCAALLVRCVPLLRQGHAVGWAIVGAAILTVCGAGMVFFPGYIGAVAGTLWFALIALPSLLIRAVLRHALGQRYLQAERVARLVRWLHPADGWREMPDIYRALAFAQAGQREHGATLLGNIAQRRGTSASAARTARIYLYRMQGQWEEFLTWTEDQTAMATNGGQAKRATWQPDPEVMLLRVRAFGETGRLGDMLRAFQDARVRLERIAHPSLWPTCQLSLFAFGGREAATARLLEGPLAGLTAEAKAFWMATAKMAAGEPQAARAELRERSARSRDAEFHRVAERRLTHDLAEAGAILSADEQALLDRIEAESRRDAAYHPPTVAGLGRAYVTLSLVALNVVGFAVEVIQGGSQNALVLARLGALWSSAVLDRGQWYRLFTALFLHFGPVHLAMNLLGLVVIGAWVEKTLGRARYAAVYFVAGVGSMTAVVYFIRWGWMRPELLVGASGAIMGLVGATGALLALGWRRERSGLAARRLRGVVFIVVLQVAFDLMTPQVSLAAHAAGALIGFVSTVLLMTARASHQRIT